MGSYLGIDAHSNAGLELAAVDAGNGELQWRHRCRLHRAALREAVHRAPRPCTVVFEQGELATWLHLVLSGTCHRLIVADARHNRLISTSPDKSDAFDALKLAELARGGYLKEIYQPPPTFETLRLRVRHHYRLPKPARAAAEDLYALMDVVVERKDGAEKLLAKAARRFPPVQRFCQIPQIGPVTATTFAAYIVTPERFPSRSHVWSYCGFGLTRRSSGSHAEPVRIRRKYNRSLKRVIKSSVERMIWHSAHPFAASFQQRVQRGMLPKRAKLSVCRKLIDVLCALWIKEQDYDPTRIAIV